MKKTFLFLVSIVINFGAMAQSVPQDTYLNNYVQPPPNAAALGKYVDYPVSFYTGVPEINIPIYDLKDGAVNLPISLSYHASGIKVSEIASWVGLGWSLNAGGAIIRTVRGAPDEGSRKNTGDGPAGYYLDSGLMDIPLLPHPEGGQIVNDPTQMNMEWYTIPGIANGDIDSEPDLFCFNFDGYSGKFVFDEDKTPRLLEDDNLKISVNFDNVQHQFTSWVITTPGGVKYFFGDNNMHEVTVPHSTSGGDDPDSQLPSDWYLTRIVYPNTKDTVYFNYTTETYTYFDLGPETELYNFDNGTHSDFISNICDNSKVKQSIIRTTVTGLRLTSIQSKNYNIEFIADSARQDLANYSTRPKRLDSIKVYNKQNQCIAQYYFNYSYFVSSLATSLQNLAFVNDSSDTKRLKLLSLTEYSGDGTISKPPYIFKYQDSLALPRRLSYDQDHWGYSNHPEGNYNPYFTPAVSYMPACNYMGGADRNPRWPQMEAATLTSIKDPLGVTTSFQYEPDSADNYYPSKMIGGLRIHMITATDSVTGRSTVRKFVYSGGNIFRNPKYLFKLQNEFYVLPTIGGVSGYSGYGNQSLIIGILKQSQSIVPLQYVNGDPIGYADVKEIFGNNGQGGSKEYHFYTDVAPGGNSRLSLNNYASLQYVNSVFYGWTNSLMGNGDFNNILPQNLQYYTGYDIGNYYPAAPYQDDFENGRLLSEYTYDSLGNLIESTINTYQNTYHENYWIRGLKVYRSVKYTTATGGFGASLPQYNDALTFYKLHTGICHLMSTTVTDYKDGKTMVSTTDYGYESPNHTLQTSDTTVNSQGDSLVNKTYYSFDYANTATSDNVFGKMKLRNLLVPISKQTWKNGQLIGGTITLYKDFANASPDTFLNPSKIYAIETTTPLTLAQSGETYSFPSQISTLLPDSYFKEKADFNFSGTTGKIIEQKLVNDKDQAIIWDNQYNLPLAVVDNAYATDVAYSSFESSETGNWTYGSSSVTTDASAPTGSHAYVLGSTAISKSGLTSGNKYIVSYWLKSGASALVSGGTQSNAVTGRTLNGWTYHEVTVTGTTSVSISGSGNIDEVRLYPSNAQMTTYCYDSLMRLISGCTANSTISYYEYDSLNRLVDIKDQYGNIVKAFEYNYGSSNR